MALSVKQDKGDLVIRIPMNSVPAPSASGKSLIVASTHGNQVTDLVIDGRPMTIGINAYCPVKAR